ncbi:MAG: hypothetical protein KF777_12800 [Planctomycetaceae bacterium]|nr:hypothetical protein [Planctomycetaceae bacterium]
MRTYRTPFGPTLLAMTALLCGTVDTDADDSAPADIIIVTGAEGSADYGRDFSLWGDRWKRAAEEAGLAVRRLDQADSSDESSDKDQLAKWIKEAGAVSDRPLWLVYLGHGTYDRRSARLNLRGPDVSPDELKEWLAPLRRPLAVVLCSSASGDFLPALSGPDRTIITATKSGGELNYTKFGDFLSQSLLDPATDLDKDGQNSLWEVFLAGSRKTIEYYETQGLLQTEHSLLDDNADQQGTRADSFRGLQPIESATGGGQLDGRLSHQWHLVPTQDTNWPADLKRKRDELVLSVLSLRDRKASLAEDAYYLELEGILLELAKLTRRVEGMPTSTDSNPAPSPVP